MTFRYIGSKARVVEAIMRCVGAPDGGRFVDAFCGTGAVAIAASRAGWPVHVNDHLQSASLTAFARLTSREKAPFRHFGGYEGALEALNKAPERQGFIWREYSPASGRHCGITRLYFTEPNACRIDGIRSAIRTWSDEGRLQSREQALLIADLMGAANKVANTAGTYGCFLSRWQRQSEEALVLEPRELPERLPPSTMEVGDVRGVECRSEDTVYLDPPYTKRQYAAYYHILETIALGDEPEVEGVCGIRPWRHIASDYCYRTRAVRALTDLVAALPARRILLSYSTDGHVPLDLLVEAMECSGRVSLHHLGEIGRYRPNQAASAGAAAVGEVLIAVDRPAASSKAAA
ncbi:MAG: DNA adenine methylase [Bauldia sp.]|nr:DNA adenine methylase [Bauldia sp.]MCW5717057.1 DNA adenine methylase [Bauldia sp.]